MVISRKPASKLHLFEAGTSGNPSGRPKGTRNKLSADFIDAIADDFSTNGAEAIKRVRDEKPDQYLKVIASLLPREVLVNDNASLENVSDVDLVEAIAALRSVVAVEEKQAKGEAPSARRSQAVN